MDVVGKSQDDDETLGFQGLDGGSLDQLTDTAAKKLQLDTDKKSLELNVMWLHERLTAMDVSQEATFTAEIAAWYWVVKAQSYDGYLVLEAFRDWQRKQAVDDPASSRRLMIAEAELHKLIDTVSGRVKAVPDPMATKNNEASSQMRSGHVQEPPGERMDIGIEDVEACGNETMNILSGTIQTNQSSGDLSFLTGSNMEPVGTVKTFSNSMARATALAAAPKKCRRCGEDVLYCPTNLDPRFDLKPPKGYKCVFCRKVEDHFGRFCPKNPDPNSIGRLRQRRPPSENEAGRNEHSQAGIGNALDRDGWERYRPADEFSRLSIEDKRSKRKATRSPSSERTRPKKPKHPWASTIGRRGILTDEREGRLSYDDELSDNVSVGSSVSGHRRSSTPSRVDSRSVDKMDTDSDGENMPLTTVDHVSARDAERRQQFEAAILNMIREESGKMDLLLVAEGVELVRAPAPALLQLFKSQSSLWVNKTLATTRCRGADFIHSPCGDREIMSMVPSGTGQVEAALPGLQASIHATDSAMIPDEPDRLDNRGDGDEEMTDAQSAAPALASQAPDARGVLPCDHLISVGHNGWPENEWSDWSKSNPSHLEPLFMQSWAGRMSGKESGGGAPRGRSELRSNSQRD
ncbi:hypothetical protein VTJ49DRAFT_4674 [Mycothermus thermophilus]|uniref:Zinc knuckle CX2CX3GHX4C domain-containing protein n=1 Tax=Humicola insolens TaxID=85995 RepID=A0ABR3VNU9_HUMIN